MAARRLVIVILLLLGVSTVAGALVRVEPPDEPATTTTTTAPERPADGEPRGELVRRRIDAAAPRADRIAVRAGDQLELTVTSRRADQVEIPRFGELRDVDRDLAARFDLLPTEPGSYEVRLVEANRTVGRIEVRPRRRARGGALLLRSASPRARPRESRSPPGSEPRRRGR